MPAILAAVLAFVMLAAASFVGASAADPPPAAAQGGCTFTLGFAALRELIVGQHGDVVGRCPEDERFNVADGNAEQRTARGLLVWRKADNWTAFADGATTWINGPAGLAGRPITGPLYPRKAATAPTSASATAPEGAHCSDNFDDAGGGRLPKSAATPGLARGYVDGEDMIRKADPNLTGHAFAPTPGSHADAAVEVGARIMGRVDQRHILVGCRRPPNADSGYEAVLQPARGQFALGRRTDGVVTVLGGWRGSAAIRRGDAGNRLGFACSGSTISLSINGVPVASVQDSTYGEGRMMIGVAVLLNSRLPAEAPFDNLIIRQP